jgi:hypothetical protein
MIALLQRQANNINMPLFSPSPYSWWNRIRFFPKSTYLAIIGTITAQKESYDL